MYCYIPMWVAIIILWLNEPATTFLRRRKTEMTFVTRRPAGPTVASSKVWGVKPNIDLYTTITFSLQETLIITNRNYIPHSDVRKEIVSQFRLTSLRVVCVSVKPFCMNVPFLYECVMWCIINYTYYSFIQNVCNI